MKLVGINSNYDDQIKDQEETIVQLNTSAISVELFHSITLAK